MNHELASLLVGQQAAIKLLEKKLDGTIERRKPSLAAKLFKKLFK